MDSLLIDLTLSGLAYVILIYMIITISKNKFSKGKGSEDDEDGGIKVEIPPTIDLPPGILWFDDSPKDSANLPQEIES